MVHYKSFPRSIRMWAVAPGTRCLAFVVALTATVGCGADRTRTRRVPEMNEASTPALRFRSPPRMHKQGVAVFDMVLRNPGAGPVRLVRWCGPEGTNNARVFVRPAGTRDEWIECEDAYLRSRAPARSDITVAAASEKRFAVRVLLTCRPGAYQMRAHLVSAPDIVTPIVPIRVAPGVVPDQRK